MMVADVSIGGGGEDNVRRSVHCNNQLSGDRWLWNGGWCEMNGKRPYLSYHILLLAFFQLVAVLAGRLITGFLPDKEINFQITRMGWQA